MSDEIFFFFFSSRRRHTRYWRDWSSDVCSSDLHLARRGFRGGLARFSFRAGPKLSDLDGGFRLERLDFLTCPGPDTLAFSLRPLAGLFLLTGDQLGRPPASVGQGLLAHLLQRRLIEACRGLPARGDQCGCARSHPTLHAEKRQPEPDQGEKYQYEEYGDDRVHT